MTSPCPALPVYLAKSTTNNTSCIFCLLILVPVYPYTLSSSVFCLLQVIPTTYVSYSNLYPVYLNSFRIPCPPVHCTVYPVYLRFFCIPCPPVYPVYLTICCTVFTLCFCVSCLRKYLLYIQSSCVSCLPSTYVSNFYAFCPPVYLVYLYVSILCIPCPPVYPVYST